MSTVVQPITKRAGRAGGEACVRETRITVWGLVAYRQLGMSDEEILRILPDVTPDNLRAAWEYAARHPKEISDAIRENESDDE